MKQYLLNILGILMMNCVGGTTTPPTTNTLIGTSCPSLSENGQEACEKANAVPDKVCVWQGTKCLTKTTTSGELTCLEHKVEANCLAPRCIWNESATLCEDPPHACADFPANNCPTTTCTVAEGLCKEQPTQAPDCKPGYVLIQDKCTVNSPTECGVLAAGQALKQGDRLTSCDNGFYLLMQEDGNLVNYDKNGIALWSTWSGPIGEKSPGSVIVSPLQAPYSAQALGNIAVMQGDGNFVVYLDTNAVWYTATNGYAGSSLKAQADGNLVLYDSQGKAIWAAGKMK